MTEIKEKLTFRGLIKKYWKLLMEAVKYSFTGVLNTLIDIGVFSLLTYFSMHRYGAKPIAFTCGIINSFLLNKFWAFGKKKKKNEFKSLELVKFITVNLIALGFSMLGIDLINKYFGIKDIFANMMVFPIPFVINFFLYKFWIFKNKSLTDESEEDEMEESSDNN